MSVSLYRKYRPQFFSDVIGQKSAVDVLTNSILRGRVGHAYLFSGSRGCGKTSAARIFAKALNCLERNGFEPCGSCRNCQEITAGESLDVIEIDGASNNGVDNIRGLKENVALSPFNSRYKIYIIDEVHMLSQGAFNALLKTLEEPPEHVIFIMATTEPHKVPVTIRSRCQHIPFRSITPDDIYSRLDYVCKNESITAEAEALREISRQADGALRDALSLLEQVIASGNITLANVEAICGAGSRPSFERWITGLRENPESPYAGLKAMFDAGASGVRVLEEIFAILRDLLIVSKWKNAADSLGLSEQEKNFLVNEASQWKPAEIHRMMRSTLRILGEARMGVRTDILLGMFMLSVEDNRLSFIPETEKVVPHATMRDETPPPVITAPAVQAPVEVKEDPVLKEEILTLAHEKNFAVWCALYDSRPMVRGNELVLDMAHRYNYTVLKIDRNAAELSEIFGKYGSVVLRYGSAEYPCPRKPTASPEIHMPAKAVKEPTKTIDFNMPLPDEKPTPSAQSPNSSFGDFIRGLSAMGLNPEVILHRQMESDDTDTDSDNEISEGDAE